MVISMLKIRRLLGGLIFNMGIAIPGKTVFLIETAPSTTCKCLFTAEKIQMDVSDPSMLEQMLAACSQNMTFHQHAPFSQSE